MERFSPMMVNLLDNTRLEMERRNFDLDGFFRELGFAQTPPLGHQCQIIRPLVVYRPINPRNGEPFLTIVTFLVDWAKPGSDKQVIGTMTRIFEKRGSIALVRVIMDDGTTRYVVIDEERFLFGTITNTVRGFDKLRQELDEELDFEGEPEIEEIGTNLPNTGTTMSISEKGDVAVTLVTFRARPKPGKGDQFGTEKIKGLHLWTLPELRQAILNGFNDPFFLQALMLLWAKERPAIFADGTEKVSVEL